MNNRLFTFVGGNSGPWRIVSMDAIAGEPLPEAAMLDVVSGRDAKLSSGEAGWILRGITSNERYTVHDEKDRLLARQPAPVRAEAVCAAFIPLRKSAAWWTLSQDERQRIFEEQSRHVSIGLRYLPTLSRRLHHCRDLGESEPFDFLTWFEYAPAEESNFNKLLAELRASPEWKYVEREVDVRLVREPG